MEQLFYSVVVGVTLGCLVVMVLSPWVVSEAPAGLVKGGCGR